MHGRVDKCLFIYFLSALLAVSSFTYGNFFYTENEGQQQQLKEYYPWFTGPLIAPSGHVVPMGHVNIEPYLYAFVESGIYDQHWHYQSIPNFYQTLFQVPIQVGFAPRLDFQLIPQVFYNETQGAHTINVGDMPVVVDIQLWLDSMDTWWPAAKLVLKANVPFGKYQHLNPHKKGTDAIGAGSWLPKIGLNFSKLYHFNTVHFLNARLVLGYTIGTPVHVKGLNSYGGASNTKGTVYPGNFFTIDGAFEYSLTQRWAIALDAIYTHSNKNRFSGNPGTTTSGPANVESPSSESFSLAPALEYNWSAKIGLIGGVWFTLGGRNATQFTSGIIALNIYI